jgi:hypothetical protein
VSAASEQIDAPGESDASSWVSRAPIIAFVAAEIIAFVLWLSIGRSEWFYNDEWDFLSTRKAGDIGDLFRPHNGHWTTIPILAYRFLFAVFGLRAYLPYRLLVLVLYLAAAALLLVVMRRAGVHPWIATSAAALFALFGAGWVNIIRPFQITFTGALLFGLLELLLSDRDGSFGRRDVLAMACGLVALMMSGVGVVMVMVAGIALLLRRGWRIALLHVAPLAAIYLVWLVAIGHQGGVVQSVTASEVSRFIATGIRASFREIGPSYWFGAPVIAAILIVGFVLATRQRSGVERAQLAAPLALLCGAVLVLAAAALQGRTVTGAAYARQSRYLSLVVALSLPALAIATDAFTRIRRWLVPFAMALFLLAIPHNIHAARASEKLAPLYAATRRVVEVVPHARAARRVPASLEPNQYTAPRLTVGWLLSAFDHHDLPGAGKIKPQELAAATFRLSFYEDDAPSPTVGCNTPLKPIIGRFQRGDTLYVSEGPLAIIPASQLDVFPGLVFGLYRKATSDPARGSAIHIVRAVGPAQLGPFDRRHRPRICLPERLRPHF